MKLFIALDTPIDTSFLHLEHSRPKTQHHITLKYLGEVDNREQSQIEGILSNVDFKPLTINTTGYNAFPNMKNPSILWIDMEENSRLMRLYKSIDYKLRAMFEPNNSYTPHITVAIAKSRQAKTELSSLLSEDIPRQSITCTYFSLYASENGIYREIKRFK